MGLNRIRRVMSTFCRSGTEKKLIRAEATFRGTKVSNLNWNRGNVNRPRSWGMGGGGNLRSEMVKGSQTYKLVMVTLAKTYHQTTVWLLHSIVQ